MKPVISIVITAYNRASFVAAAIGSVLRQTRGDFELVVFDDGSTDDTVAVARKAAGDDPRVRVVIGEHGGMSNALNAAAALMTGKYFGCLDSDDALMPAALEETAAVLDARPEIGMVYTDYLVMDESGRVTGQGTRSKIPYSKDRLLIDFMTFHFRLMRRELFDRVGGYAQDFDSAEDYDLCLKLSEITEIQHIARPLYLYRVHTNSISATKRMHQIEMSKRAIAAALVRRGLDKEFEIDVEIVGKFWLKKRSPPT